MADCSPLSFPRSLLECRVRRRISFLPSRAFLFSILSFSGVSQMSRTLRGPGARSRRRGLSVESLEVRQVLAGDLAAAIADGVLQIEGTAGGNGIQLRGEQAEVADTQQLVSGTTSVFLDLDLLAQAANLELSSVTSDGTPFSDDFQVGFPIIDATDFEFSVVDGFAPVGGSIEHEGTVGFNEDAIIVGDFSIGFDADRVSDVASGFFVADTFSNLGPLFDLSPPGTVAFDAPDVTLADTDLLVSPEFAGLLQDLNLAEGDLTGADVGDARVDGQAAEIIRRRVDDGTTSVFLDVDLLANAANLQVSSIVSNGVPASDDFQVGFPIEPSSDFELTTEDGLTIEGGAIRHTGSVGFNDDAIIVGDFAIGFDAARAVNGASGFFVEDTIAGLGVLFDVGAPGSLSLDDPDLSIQQADLLVSPEFATLLQDLGLAGSDLTGADVGDAQIDAELVQQTIDSIVVTESRGGTVNGGDSATFAVERLDGIQIEAGGGVDFVRMRNLRFFGDTEVHLGGGFLNRLSVSNSVLPGSLTMKGGRFGERFESHDAWIGELNLDLGGGVDSVTLFDSQAGDLNVNSDGGLFQRVGVWRSTITGAANVNIDGLFTWTNVYHSTINALNFEGGERNDQLSLISSRVARDAVVDMNGGWDRVLFFRSDVDGDATLDGGAGRFDSLNAFFANFGSTNFSGFERERI